MPAQSMPIDGNTTAYTYNGKNASKLTEAVDDFQVVEEGDDGLTFTSGGQQMTLPRGGYMVVADGRVSGVFETEDSLRASYPDAGQQQ